MSENQRFRFSNMLTARALNRERGNAMTEMFDRGFPYSKSLYAHKSCINALSFSSGDGRFLASGGDDCDIHLWDFHQEHVNDPCWTLEGPRGNIFRLAWSASNRFLFCGGNDESLLKYDVSRMHTAVSYPVNPGSPNEINRDHSEPVSDISCHPSHDEVFLSSSMDGSVRIHDDRAASGSLSKAQSTLQLTQEVTGVQFHPIMDHIFATSDGRGRVCLRDARMAFGPLTQRTQQGVVRKFNTTLSKAGLSYFSNPEASSLVFDRDGSTLAVTMLHFYPTIYSVSDPHPLAICTGRNLPTGEPVPPEERTYSNSCTTKHGSFGGLGLDRDQYYSAPSDDFHGYMWKLPDLADLAERRTEISASEWADQSPGTIAFAESLSEPRYIPVELSTPICRLTGHDSIVNSTLIHPRLMYILTSGIERKILVHSPMSSSPSFQDMDQSPTFVRHLTEVESSSARFIRDITESYVSTSGMAGAAFDEIRTIQIFDRILREEGNGDVFELRRWRGERYSDSDSDSDSDYSSVDTDADMDVLI